MGNAESSQQNSPKHNVSAASPQSDEPKQKRHGRQQQSSSDRERRYRVDSNATFNSSKPALNRGTQQDGDGSTPSTYYFMYNSAQSKTLAAPLSKPLEQPLQQQKSVKQEVPAVENSDLQNQTPTAKNNDFEIQSQSTVLNSSDIDADDIDSAYLTASTGFSSELQSSRAIMGTLTQDDLKSRIDKFNQNSHELRMSLDAVTGTIQGFIRVHMNILNPVSIRRSAASSLRDVMSRTLDFNNAAANDGSSTLIVNIPQDRTTLVNVTSKTTTFEVIQLLLTKFHIVDTLERFALFEKDSSSLALHKLGPDEVPLMISLSWSDEGLHMFDRKQFVLKEVHVDKPQWELFSLAELQGFIHFLNREESEQEKVIHERYDKLRECFAERLQYLEAELHASS